MNIRKIAAPKPTNEVFENAFWILKQSHKSAESLFSAFNSIRASKRTVGKTTHEEQDILRAMLILTSSGLDALLKQLIRDTLHLLISIDTMAKKELEKFVDRKIRDGLEQPQKTILREFLTSILTANSRKDQIIKEYKQQLIANSLQSIPELNKCCAALGLKDGDIKVKQDDIKKGFDIRNLIVHELDINFAGKKSNRHQRAKDDMAFYTNIILELSENIYKTLADKIKK
ncbi:MAG: HEPN domain-containing protein [Candidatus Omnitrophota bacterium]